MALSMSEILLRSKEGPIIEEKTFDMSIFMKTQELQKKFDIRYDPEKLVDPVWPSCTIRSIPGQKI